MCGDRTAYFLNLFEKETTNDKETYDIYEKRELLSLKEAIQCFLCWLLLFENELTYVGFERDAENPIFSS